MRRSLLLILAFVLLVSTSVALAQGGFDMARHVLGGGGGRISGGPYALDSTLAQPVAGVLQGGSYRIDVGFWAPAAVTTMHYVYLPLILRHRQ
jgi:hypothetical protein